MSKKVPQRQEYEDECVGACHSAESNCACAVWWRTLLPSVYSFSSKRCFQNLARSKDGDGGALAVQRNKLPNAPCVCVCVCRFNADTKCIPAPRWWVRGAEESSKKFQQFWFAIIQIRFPLAAHVQRKERIHRRSSACFHSAPLSKHFIDSLKPFSLSFFFSPANFIPLICLEWLQVPPLTALWGVQMMAERFVQALWLSEAEKSRRTGGFNVQKWP